MYSKLQRVELYTSDGISEIVSIIQDNVPTSIPRDTAYFHIDEQDEQLKLYVPRSKNERQICLSRLLPVTLLRHLGIQNQTKAACLGSIITASGLYVVDAILEQDGIIEFSGITRPEDDSEYDSSDSESDENVTSPESIPRTPYSEQSTGYFPQPRHSQFNGNSHEDPFLTPATSISYGSPRPIERPDLYKNLLDAVIKQAENLEGLPSAGDTIVSTLPALRLVDTSNALRSTVPGEDLFKIGAAGELFVSYMSMLNYIFLLTYSRCMSY